MRIIYFARRNFIELMREPLSSIFCLGFPLIMLFIMTIVNNSIPKEANMTLFEIQNIGPGIVIFGFTFVMLFTSLRVANDRKNTFLIRLYASPMKGIDFISGYTLPMIGISLIECLVTLFASLILGYMNEYSFHIGYLLLNLIFLIPSIILFIGFGLLFGTLFNENTAPGISSILISACGMLGGIWMDVDALGNGLLTFCKALPFYYCVKVAKLVTVGDFSGAMKPLFITLLYAIGVYLIAVLVFRSKMQKDLK